MKRYIIKELCMCLALAEQQILKHVGSMQYQFRLIKMRIVSCHSASANSTRQRWTSFKFW